jgi:hypothetical protein
MPPISPLTLTKNNSDGQQCHQYHLSPSLTKNNSDGQQCHQYHLSPSPKTTVMVNNATNITSHLHSPKTKRDHDLVMLEIQVPSWDRQRNVVG